MAIELDSFQPRTTPSKPSGDLLDRLRGGANTNSSRFFGKLKRRVPEKDRMFFTEQLALLLDTGTSLLEALQAIGSQTEDSALGPVIDTLINTIKEGQPFSQALAQHPTIFSSTYINLIAASESGGFMPQVLEELLEMEEKRERLNATLKSALRRSRFFGKLKRRVPEKDRMFFTEQLALLLDTGTSLLEALQAIGSQTEDSALGPVIDTLINTIKEGQPFSQALAQHPTIFSSTYINLIAASESGGFMPQVLEELLEMEEKRERLNATLKSALSYPAFLMLFSLGVVIFVLVVVFPKFSSSMTI